MTAKPEYPATTHADAKIVLMGPARCGKQTLIRATLRDAAANNSLVSAASRALGESFASDVRYTTGNPRERQAYGLCFVHSQTGGPILHQSQIAKDAREFYVALDPRRPLQELGIRYTKIGCRGAPTSEDVRRYLEHRRHEPHAFGVVTRLPVHRDGRQERYHTEAVETWLDGLCAYYDRRALMPYVHPFVFFVETYRGKVRQQLLRERRRMSEIALYRRFGRAFLYFQIDLDNGTAIERLWRNVACQTAAQLSVAPRGRINVVADNPLYVSDLVDRTGTLIGRALRRVVSQWQRCWGDRRRGGSWMRWRDDAYDGDDVLELYDV